MKITLPLFLGIFAITTSAQSPSNNDIDWAYSGCYTTTSPGHILDLLKKPNVTSEVTIETCWAACATRFSALGAGQCYCTDTLLPTLQLSSSDANCTFSCASKTSEACGGPIDEETQEPSALSLYDSSPPAAITYPGWEYVGCVDHFSSIGNFTHIATRDRTTIEGCLSGCDQAGLKYEFAALSAQSCYCATKKNVNVPSKFVEDSNICTTPCLGNPAQACGGPFTEFDAAVALYSRTSGPGDPKVTEIFSGVLMSRTTSAPEPTKTSGKGGNGNGDDGAVATGTGTKSASLATGTGEGSAGRIGRVGGWGVLMGIVGAVVV